MKTDVLIATVLLGWKEDRSFPDKGRVFRSPGGALEMDTTFKFKTDYNELMKVWDAIEALGWRTSIINCPDQKKYVSWIEDADGEIICTFTTPTRLEAMYLVVCHFALWISKGKPKIEI